MPILVDEDKQIIAGHGRVEAAKKLGMKEVPTILVDHLTKEQKKAFIIADNKITENAGWDLELLSIELEDLSLSTDFDISLTGFETAEIDLIIDGDEIIESDPADEVPEIDNVPAITKLGDVWQLGDHRLICSDSTNKETYKALLGEQKAAAIFTDPPYNVPIDGHVCGNGKVKHSNFAMASGEMSEDEFIKFLQKFIELAINSSSDGSGI